MTIIYAIWHQAEGVVTTHLFKERPTEAQTRALRRELEKRHSRPDMEMRVREVQLLDAGEVPEFAERAPAASDAAAQAALAMFSVSGTGRIE